MRRFRFIRNPLANAIGNNVEEFLAGLAGPACIYLDGEDSSRTRAFVTLLHGNEPSGNRGTDVRAKDDSQRTGRAQAGGIYQYGFS